jgi:protein involved in polysaccharide export with SLBB domain
MTNHESQKGSGVIGSLRKVSVLWVVVGLGFAGCSTKLLDPTQVGRFRPTPAVNVILDSLGVAEETPVAWESAEEPRPKDVIPQKGDYALRPGDLIQVSIYELLQEGVPLASQFLVSETGKISIPEVGIVQAAGLTETQLEEEIRRILSPNILKEPMVTAILLDSQQRTFSILGNGVPQPGRYLIPRYDFRLTDALATARGPMQFNVSYVYVSRKDDGQAQLAGPASGDISRRDSLQTAVPAGLGTMKPASTTEPELQLIQPPSNGQRGPQSLPMSPQPQPSVIPTARSDIPEPKEPAEKFELEREMLDLIAPSAKKVNVPASTTVTPPPAPSKKKDENVSATVMPYGFRLLTPPSEQKPPRTQDIVQTPIVLADESDTPAPGVSSGSKAGQGYEWVFRNGQWVPMPAKAGAAPRPAPQETGAVATGPLTGGQSEWVYRDGQWVQIPKGQPAAAAPPVGPQIRGPTLPLDGDELPPEIEWEHAMPSRVLRIPVEKLLAGDPRYNVVIKPGDTVYVPVDIIGEFFIMGNVNRAGVINIPGRPMTLKMAIAAAGGLGPLAWPKNVEVIRRIGRDKEEIVMVDMDKIAAGEQPDFFIKPLDQINVGTHPSARFRAILRNAFRAAYGFGFVYDRNFADADFGKGFVLPSWL